MHSLPDLAMKNESIRTDLKQLTGYPLQMQLNGFGTPEPLAWSVWSDGQLVTTGGFLEEPGLPLHMILPSEQLERLPEEVQDVVYFAPWAQFTVLQAMLTSHQAFELALSNPLLFILLVECSVLKMLTKESFGWLVQQPRADILHQVGLTESASAVRILSRTRGRMKTRQDLHAICRVLRDDHLLSHLRHLQQPTIAAFLLVDYMPEIVWPGLLKMLHPNDGMAKVKALSTLVSRLKTLGASCQRLHRLNQAAELQATFDRFRERQNQHLASYYQKKFGPYPPAPVPGNEYVKPLVSWNELLSEGHKMRHCVASHAERVSAGEIFIYRVELNLRLTLSLWKTDDGWAVKELKGLANSTPDDSAVRMVQKWLDRDSVQKGSPW